MQRLRWLLGLAVVVLLLLVACIRGTDRAQVGISELVNTVLAIWMADAAGF